MIGRNIAPIERNPRRFIQRLWGIPNIHARQKWRTMWPILESLPEHSLDLLDAGCGPGLWPLEIAARRPGWNITGIDIDPKVIEKAEARRKKIGFNHVHFKQADFLNFEDDQQYDVVISLFSAHYCVEMGQGDNLFGHFNKWLKPGGLLILLLPRKYTETPCVSWLPSLHRQKVFSREDAIGFCERHGFFVSQLSARIGRLGSFAKQIDFALNSQHSLLSAISYPLSCSMISLDRMLSGGSEHSSLWWLLVAKKTCHMPPELREDADQLQPETSSNSTTIPLGTVDSMQD